MIEHSQSTPQAFPRRIFLKKSAFAGASALLLAQGISLASGTGSGSYKVKGVITWSDESNKKVSAIFGNPFSGTTCECWPETSITSPNPDGTVTVSWFMRATVSSPPTPDDGSTPLSGTITGSHTWQVTGTVPSTGNFFTYTKVPSTAIPYEIDLLIVKPYVGLDSMGDNALKKVVARCRVAAETPVGTPPYLTSYTQTVRYFMVRQILTGGAWVDEYYSSTKFMYPRVEKIYAV